jgi:hypothetical protein
MSKSRSLTFAEYKAAEQKYLANFRTLDEQIAEHERIKTLTEQHGITPTGFFLSVLEYAYARRDEGVDTPLTYHQMRGAQYQYIVLEKAGVNAEG